MNEDQTGEGESRRAKRFAQNCTHLQYFPSITSQCKQWVSLSKDTLQLQTGRAVSHQGVAFPRCDVFSGNIHKHLEIELHDSSFRRMENVSLRSCKVEVM